MAMGLFVHFGLYSQLRQGEWAMHLRHIPHEEYRQLASSFTAVDFDAERLAALAKNAGMRYMVLTTRHHEGFSLYNTRGLSDYDAMHTPARRDLVAEFVAACRKHGLVPFFYHTTLDWYQPSFDNDFDSYLAYLRQSVELLCTHYGEVGGFWFDGNWSKPEADWKLDELYGTIRRLQPNAIIINNTGLDAAGVLEHPEIDGVTFEQQLPTPVDANGAQRHITGEMCFTLCDHWGYAAQDFNWKAPASLIKNLCRCRAAGANYLLNIGPGPQGAVSLLDEAYLELLGRWVSLHGEAIYTTRPARIHGADGGWVLRALDGALYFLIPGVGIRGDKNVTAAPAGEGAYAFSNVTEEIAVVRWLDNGEALPFAQDKGSGLFTFYATGQPYGQNMVVRVAKATFKHP